MNYRHEPRSWRGVIYCINDGELWPCAVELNRRVAQAPHRHYDEGVEECPGCVYDRAQVELNRRQRQEAADRSGI